MNLTKSSLRLYASPKAVITLFLYLPGSNRITNVVQRVEKLENTVAQSSMQKVMKEFAGRHRDIEKTFLKHFSRIENQTGESLSHFSPLKKLLLGAFFTKEYSIQAAALFNPSVVPHPDQQNLNAGELRFVMSMRATGEGHISSVVFQTGIADDQGNVFPDKGPEYYTCLHLNGEAKFSKDFISKCAQSFPGFNNSILDLLPDSFSASQADRIFRSTSPHDAAIVDSLVIIEKILDSNYDLECSLHIPINEKVIFPNATSERMGMEDVRFVKFNDEERSCYYGTYTAYDGTHIKSQLIETSDFNIFKIRTLYGEAVSDKGMALFPEKVNGKYVMISRQGGETMNIMYSDDLHLWENFCVLIKPEFLWELVQLGNCGSPVKTEKGWLLLTHGVSTMRTYVISAILLDLHDPSLIIGRLNKPLIEADENERDGYVPNVAYTCGMMLHQKMLIIPYAISDSSTAFATIRLDELLSEMKP
ncbi:MAG: glycoside hydrolase family 130 protein [Chitinophagales bacterium]